MASGGLPDPGRPVDTDRQGDTPLIPAPDSEITASSDDPDDQASSDPNQLSDTGSGPDTSGVHPDQAADTGSGPDTSGVYVDQTSDTGSELETAEVHPDQSSDTGSELETYGVQGRSSLTSMLTPISSKWKLKVFLMDIARDIDEEGLNEMKFLMKGECGMGKRALSVITTVKQFFSHLMEIDFVDEYNLLQLQNLLWQIHRKDLHARFVEFAREYRNSPLHFFTPNPNPRNGYKYADFHIGGKQLETTSKQELETLRKEVAELIGVPPRFIFIKGLEPLHSLIVTLMVPAAAVFALFELSEVEKSTLQSLRIDSFGVGDKRVVLANIKFEKAASLSEKEEIQRILKKKEILTSELDKSQARLIERVKELSSSEEELAKVKVTSEQLKMSNDQAMMILATLVYQDLTHKSSPTDSLSRLSILTYFKFCLKQFQLQYPEAAEHVGDLLDANALVVQKTQRDLHKNYVERLQINQLALEHKCQTVQPVHTLADHLAQQPSEVVRQQFINTKSQQQPSQPLTLTPSLQRKDSPIRKKLYQRRTEKPVHPYSSVLMEISLKLTESQKEKLLGNISFNKVEKSEVAKQPKKFLHLLFEKELGGIPADPCDHVLRKLRVIEDHDLQSSADKLLSKCRSDLKKDVESSSGKKTSDIFGRKEHKSATPIGKSVQSADADQFQNVAKKIEERGGTSGVSELKKRKNIFSTSMYKPGERDRRDMLAGVSAPGEEQEVQGVHKSASESALRRLDSSDEMCEKLDKLLSEVEDVKMLLQNQAKLYQSPVGMGARPFHLPSPTTDLY